jgi:hypothetical protein
MSLFSTREWWDTRLGSNEEFHLGSLCVANIDNDPSGAGVWVRTHSMLWSHVQRGACAWRYPSGRVQIAGC